LFLLHRPSPQAVARFLDTSRYLPLSYEPVGLARSGADGFRMDEEVAVVGAGDAAFALATTALAEWRHFDLGWVELHPGQSGIADGAVVAVAIRHFGFWSLNGCRVVYSTSDSRQSSFGFAYGTLTNHAECGEELFEVRLAPGSGEVTYRIRAVSRPRAALARLGYPLTRLLQTRFRRDSVAAVRRAISLAQER
jgi:uncharacterized protein (UPF0548 family)